MRGKVDHFFHLAAIYDMTADAESQRVANVEGTRHAVELAEARSTPAASTRSARSPPPASTRASCARTCSRRPKGSTPSLLPHQARVRAVVREECRGPGGSTGRGSSSATRETGEIDKIDGPYYFFKLLQRARDACCPPWLPTSGIEGGEINIVPVDFVAEAIDHIAHQPTASTGRPSTSPTPNPQTAGEVINIFAKAADAPQVAMRLDSGRRLRSRERRWRSRR